MPRRRLEDLLLDEGLLDEVGLRHARRHARKHGVSLARAVVESGLSDEALAEAVARRLRLPRVDLQRENVDGDALREVPFDLADSRRLLPLSIDRTGRRRVIRVAMADPLDIDAVEEIEMTTGCQLEAMVAPVNELGEAATRHYSGIITKMIPRKFPERAPTTQPTHRVADEASLELRLQAVVDQLVERGHLDRDALSEAVRRLVKEKSGE
jgi:type IV pilus assembly protein PilB